ncbi:MAG: putative bifunctional diguanylate cyclase/phosphodiesterase, partial [Actinomycetes bacterium]
TLYSLYRSYLRAKQDRNVWQQLEAATRELNMLDEAEVASAALRRARQLFRADSVELVVTHRTDVTRTYSVNEEDNVVLTEAAGARRNDGPATYRVVDLSAGDDDMLTCLVSPLEGPNGRVGALRLIFDGPVKLRHRERQVLSTFSHAVSTTLLNAALYDDVRAEASRKAYEASHDHLTGLGNRSLLGARTRTAIAEADGTTALLLLDLDHFKEINDTLGHAAGDVLLQEVGRRLREFAGDEHLVARLGGDEFAVLLTGLRSAEEAEPVAEAVLDLLEEPVEFEGLRLSVEASLGVACHPQDADSSEEMFRRADVAMYQAKSTRGQWLRYSVDRDDSSVHRQALVAELRAALELDQIIVHFQPQVDLESGLLVGAEALCRWEHPTRGVLAPGEFVSVAEHSGLVRPFTLRVLDQAVAQCVLWQDAGRPVSVAVNLSARSLLDRQLPRDVATVLARHGLPPDRLVLEITETTATSELDVVEEVLGALRDMGVELSVDDFGTGYSSLAFLQRTAVHELKVDRTFVNGMMQSENDLALVRATVQLARSLGARSVAEGVEDGAQAAALREMGCDVAQGYWLSKPIPASGMRSLLGLRVIAEPPAAVPAPRSGTELRVLRPVAAEST